MPIIVFKPKYVSIPVTSSNKFVFSYAFKDFMHRCFLATSLACVFFHITIDYPLGLSVTTVVLGGGPVRCFRHFSHTHRCTIHIRIDVQYTCISMSKKVMHTTLRCRLFSSLQWAS